MFLWSYFGIIQRICEELLRRRMNQVIKRLSVFEPKGDSCAPRKLKIHRAVLLNNLKLCMDLKIIYAKFQGSQFIDELEKPLLRMDLFVKLLISGVSWSIAVFFFKIL